MRSGVFEESIYGVEDEEGGEKEVVEGGTNGVLNALGQHNDADLVAEREKGHSKAADVGDRDDNADAGGVETGATPALTPVELVALFGHSWSGPFPSTSGSGSARSGAVVPAVKRTVLLQAVVSTAWYLGETNYLVVDGDRHGTLGAREVKPLRSYVKRETTLIDS